MGEDEISPEKDPILSLNLCPFYDRLLVMSHFVVLLRLG